MPKTKLVAKSKTLPTKNRNAPRHKARNAEIHHSKALAKVPTVAEAIEKVMIQGDLSPLSVEQRLEYYRAMCKSLGLNSLTRPFDYISFREREDSPARLCLYARKDATEQLRKIYGVSVVNEAETIDADFVSVTVTVRDKTGRTDTGLGVIPLTGWDRKKQESYQLKGLALANARMKCSTKAKRRATLSICGLGILDESEFDTLVRGEDYWEVTPAGRRIEEAKPKPEFTGNEQKYFDRLTPEQRAVEQEQIRKAQQKDSPGQRGTTANGGSVRTEVAPQNESVSGAPAIFAKFFKESQTFQLTGPRELLLKYKDTLIRKYWNMTSKCFVIKNADELSELAVALQGEGIALREDKERS